MYRKQFILGPRFASGFDSWRQMRLCEDIYITAHPELPLHYRCIEDYSIALIGYCLDPIRPNDDNDAILERLINEWVNGSNIITATGELGGRWIFITSGPSGSFLFHDAGGLRQVFHTDRLVDGGIWCASQPPLLEQLLGIPLDEEAKNFMNSTEFRNMRGGAWWPGYGSPWSGVRRLLPNHALNLKSGQSNRYWPSAPVGRVTVDAAVETGAMLLKGLVQSAAQRFDLELLITSGWDSRLLLAACKAVQNDISYVSIVTPDSPERDTAVPGELLSRLGLKHTIEKPPPEPSEPYWKNYSKNAMFAHRSYASNAEVLHRRLDRKKVAITGHMGEIIKGFYKLAPLHNRRFPPETMTRLTGLGENNFACNAFAEWRAQATPLFDVQLSDLFYWEQRVGSWLPTWLLEYDWSWHDCFIPMNCRWFLSEMLAVPQLERRPPIVELYRKLILSMWPEVLLSAVGRTHVPIRPASSLELIARNSRTILRNTRDNTKYILGLPSNPSGS